MNPIDELLRGMQSQQHTPAERSCAWADTMSAVADGLRPGDEAMLIVCRKGRTRIIKSDNGIASIILKRAEDARKKLNWE